MASGRQTAVADRNRNTIRYTWDDNGHLTTITDPLGSATTLAYDASGRIASITDPYGLDPVEGRGERTYEAFTDRVSNPAIDSGIGHGLGQLPVGSSAGTIFSTYKPWLDVIKVWRSDSPAQAGLEWYEGRWWNPAAPYMDDFLTLGGAYDRRDARVHRVCGLVGGLRNFFAPQLHGARR